MSPAIGEAAPAFDLPDTEGARHALGGDGDRGDAAATVVVFTCNHCPYALAWHDRLVDVARDYADRGVRVLLINPNDGERYPRDSFDAMRERVAPDGAIAYRGAPDADHGDPSLGAGWLRAALDDVLAGRPVDNAETTPVGCSVKWRR